MVSPETHYGRLTKDTVWGTAISPASIVMECQQLSVSLRCFVHKATSAEPLKSGTRTSAVVYVGPPRESWPKGHPSVSGVGMGGKKSCRKRGGRELPSVITLSGRAFRELSKCLEGSKSLSILNKDQVLGSP